VQRRLPRTTAASWPPETLTPTRGFGFACSDLDRRASECLPFLRTGQPTARNSAGVRNRAGRDVSRLRHAGHPGQKFCGEWRTQPRPRADGHRGAERVERKQVTVLFADVARSMELAERLDADEWTQLIQRVFAICRDAVTAYGGTIDKFTGDGRDGAVRCADRPGGPRTTGLSRRPAHCRGDARPRFGATDPRKCSWPSESD